MQAVDVIAKEGGELVRRNGRKYISLIVVLFAFTFLVGVAFAFSPGRLVVVGRVNVAPLLDMGEWVLEYPEEEYVRGYEYEYREYPEGEHVEEPEPEIDQEPVPEPEPEIDQEPVPEPEPEIDQEPMPEPEPEIDQEPEPEPEREIDQEPVSEPEPDIGPELESEPE